MKRTTMNFIIDTVLFFSMLITAITGLLVWFVFPHEMGYEQIAELLEEIHKWASLILLILTFYHFVVHWDWYKQVLRRVIK